MLFLGNLAGSPENCHASFLEKTGVPSSAIFDAQSPQENHVNNKKEVDVMSGHSVTPLPICTKLCRGPRPPTKTASQ